MMVRVGAVLGTYEIMELIGEGGMGAVYRARDSRLGREVAIKVIRPELASHPDRLARFDREARLLASLNHPNIATVYGFEVIDNVPFLVMELIAGDTLADRSRLGPLPVKEALTIGGQIAAAMETAHDRGVIHRDLKPSNIKLTPSGSVKVLDFGLAKALHTDATAEAIAGIPHPDVRRHRGRTRSRHRGIHESRADARQADRPPHRCVGIWLRSVRHVDGAAGFRRRHTLGHALEYPHARSRLERRAAARPSNDSSSSASVSREGPRSPPSRHG